MPIQDLLQQLRFYTQALENEDKETSRCGYCYKALPQGKGIQGHLYGSNSKKPLLRSLKNGFSKRSTK
ncbi:MAG: hypothetical protein ACTSR8_12010 [Promethearchaeota archaeon]